tara:strand:+ start:670 stop:2142 length:1473 start_codon:yes stop_codon:yes gene_type:complete
MYKLPLNIEKINETYLRATCDDSGFLRELSDYFTFEIPNWQFMPQARNRMWDGKIRLFNWHKKLLYLGLLPYVRKFCEDRRVKVSYKEDEFSYTPDVSESDVEEWMEDQTLKITPRYYQTEGLLHAINSQRAVIISPTGSGKSYLMYLMTLYFEVRTLIVVPTLSLVEQMVKDFKDYGWHQSIHKIKAGADKDTLMQVTVSTWQSIHKMGSKWFNAYDLIMIDECHLATAQSLKAIMEKSTEVPLRYGLTGTLQDSKTNRLVLEGLFGTIKRLTTSKSLMDEGTLAKLNIKTVVLEYPKQLNETLKEYNYQEEIDFLCANPARNNFIKNLACDQEGITLVLFQFIEKHGLEIFNLIEQKSEYPVYYIHGGVDADHREQVRMICEKQDNAIIVASLGTFSTGINIPKIESVIFAHPTKSKIRTLQSIGRGLRKTKDKSNMVLFDIVDDLSWRNHKNYTFKHFQERLAFYTTEQFAVKIIRIPLAQHESKTD